MRRKGERKATANNLQEVAFGVLAPVTQGQRVGVVPETQGQRLQWGRVARIILQCRCTSRVGRHRGTSADRPQGALYRGFAPVT
jgi:hypothetical protein